MVRAIDDLIPLVILSLIGRERQSQLRCRLSTFGLTKLFAFEFREFLAGQARRMPQARRRALAQAHALVA